MGSGDPLTSSDRLAEHEHQWQPLEIPFPMDMSAEITSVTVLCVCTSCPDLPDGSKNLSWTWLTFRNYVEVDPDQ